MRCEHGTLISLPPNIYNQCLLHHTVLMFQLLIYKLYIGCSIIHCKHLQRLDANTYRNLSQGSEIQVQSQPTGPGESFRLYLMCWRYFKSHTVIILFQRVPWFLPVAGPSTVITCGMVIPPETIISVES